MTKPVFFANSKREHLLIGVLVGVILASAAYSLGVYLGIGA